MNCMCFECVSEKGLDNPSMPPDGWHIEKNPKPIPDRRYDWDFWHDDYDGADGGNGLAGEAESWDDAVEQCWGIEAARQYEIIMNAKTNVIPKGAIFTITSGEYSDYQIETVCKAMREIDVRSLQDEYLSEHTEQSGDFRFNKSTFLSWIVNEKGYAEEIDFFEFHVGDYGNSDFRLW